MVAMLLVTALAVAQYPTPAQKPAEQDTARARPSQNAPQAGRRDASRSQAPENQTAFRMEMRRLWGDHITYTRNFIVSNAAGLGDTAVIRERLLRNQDEIGEAIKPYYGDEAGSQLAELLRGHITLAGQAFVAAKENQTAMAGGQQMRRDTTSRDTTRLRDPVKIEGRDTAAVRGRDTTRARPQQGQPRDTTSARQNPLPGRDTSASARNQPGERGQPGRDTANIARQQGQQPQQGRYGQVGEQQHRDADAQSLDGAVQALRANADSIADFLSKANPRHWNRTALRTALRQHIDLLIQQVNTRLRSDWAADVAAFDASHKQALEMADMLSDGIIRQFPNRFTNRTTAMTNRE